MSSSSWNLTSMRLRPRKNNHNHRRNNMNNRAMAILNAMNAIALNLAILCTLTCTSSTSFAFTPILPHFHRHTHTRLNTQLQPRQFTSSSTSSPRSISTTSALHLIKDKKIQYNNNNNINIRSQNRLKPKNTNLFRSQSKPEPKKRNNISSKFAAASTTATSTSHHHHATSTRARTFVSKQTQRAKPKSKINILDMNMPNPMDMDMPSMKEMMSNRTDFEMAVMSTLAITVPIGIIATLAMEESGSLARSSQDFTRDLLSLSTLDPKDIRVQGAVTILAEDGIDVLEDGIESLEALSMNVFDAAVPTTATDMISIALGEGIAAGIGSFVTAVVGTFAKTKGLLQDALKSTNAKKEAFALFAEGPLLAGAIADADYFLTRAAALPLLGAVGLPTFLSVVVATIPSQLVKLSARQKEQRVKEDLYMEALLQEERLRKEKERLRLNPLAFVQQQLGRTTKPSTMSSSSSLALTEARIVMENEQQKASMSAMTKASEMNVAPGAANQIDFVEIFGDITKWLEYEVLINELGGTLVWNNAPMSSGFESAIFGFLASLSSQLYSDIIYRYFDAGSEYNREASRARGPKDTAILYLVRCLSAATLFGVYESARAPISNFITNLLSGGVDSCLGSDNFDLCIETYFVDNTPDASFEGEFRAFFVAAMNLLERFGEKGNFEKSEEFLRSVLVQLDSLLHFA